MRVLGVDLEIDIVDIGANYLGYDAPYMPLLDQKIAHLVGFEPNPQALAILNKRKGTREKYLPYAVGDGNRHQLRLCKMSGMSSLFEPDFTYLNYFHYHPKWAEVVERVDVDTVRLDNVDEVSRLDYLKIDIQGGELMVFENAKQKIKDCVVIHSEVLFVPMYVGQPLFSEVDIFLRSQGFLLHRFEPLVKYMISPLVINNNSHDGISQVSYADAIFIRNYSQLMLLSSEQIIRMCVLLHDIYKSYDLVYRCLLEHDQRFGTQHASQYLLLITGKLVSHLE